MEQYEEFSSFYARCPICKEFNINQKMCELFYFSPKYSYFRDLLIDKMNETKELDDANIEESYFGIPCDDCFSITKNIQGKYREVC